MSERYRLVFRGEVQEGQHPAVVRKKLGKALQLQGAQLDMLFSGKAVILKRDTDTPTAARYQALFKESGARLRILPTDPVPSVGAAGTGSGPGSDAGSGGEPAVLPLGSDVLRSDERPKVEAVQVATGHLTLADAGSDLGRGTGPADAPEDLTHLNFEVAEVGVEMDQRPRRPPPPPPDTAHLEIAPEDGTD